MVKSDWARAAAGSPKCSLPVTPGRSRHGRAGTHPEIAIDYGAASAGDRGGAQDPKRDGRSKRDWRLGGRRIVVHEQQDNGEEKSSS